MGLCSNTSRRNSNHIPWREMYTSAAAGYQSSIPPYMQQITPHRRSRSFSQEYIISSHHDHSFSLRRLHQLSYHSEEDAPKSRPFSSLRSKSPSVISEEQPCPSVPLQNKKTSPKLKATMSLPANTILPTVTSAPFHSAPSSLRPSDAKPEDMDDKGTWTLNPRYFQLAMYVAMAHAILGALILLLYGVWILLDDYRKPIQWAVLCSMPLREVQRVMVNFWEKPLKQGFLQTMWAVPAALFKALIGTMMDARIGLHYLQGKGPLKLTRKVGFSTLMQWLVSFAFFTLGYEFLGPASLATAAFVGMLVYAAGTSLGIMAPLSGHLDVQATWSMLSAKHSKLQNGQKMRWLWTLRPILRFFELVNTRMTSGFLGSLHFVVALFLISMMIIGSLAGLVLFSYKVGIEGKDAVVAVKAHIQRSNYAERVGLKQWIEDNNVPELIETYAGRAYGTVSDQIDGFAAQYNLTDLVKAGKKYIRSLSRRQTFGENVSEISFFQVGPSPLLLEKLQSARSKFGEYDFKGVYFELEQATMLVLEHLHISREDLIDKTRQLGKRWLDIGKQVAAGGSTLLAGSIYLLISISYSVASGAAGVLNFVMQMVVFFSVLYYLIVSQTGGVMEQVLGMAPLSESTRIRCATVLEETVSTVLLSRAKAAVFQAAFTWLLFRFFNIHFLYMSTLLAFISALLSLPCWFQVSSLLGGAQLAVERRYVQSVLLMVVHMGVVRCGVSAIHKGGPSHFTGISLAVGVVLFWPSPEKAIMGPLFITLLVAMKNLYLEFVLNNGKEGLKQELMTSS